MARHQVPRNQDQLRPELAWARPYPVARAPVVQKCNLGGAATHVQSSLALGCPTQGLVRPPSRRRKNLQTDAWVLWSSPAHNCAMYSTNLLTSTLLKKNQDYGHLWRYELLTLFSQFHPPRSMQSASPRSRQSDLDAREPPHRSPDTTRPGPWTADFDTPSDKSSACLTHVEPHKLLNDRTWSPASC